MLLQSIHELLHRQRSSGLSGPDETHQAMLQSAASFSALMPAGDIFEGAQQQAHPSWGSLFLPAVETEAVSSALWPHAQ